MFVRLRIYTETRSDPISVPANQRVSTRTDIGRIVLTVGCLGGEAYLLCTHVDSEIRSMDLASLQYDKVDHSSQGTISYVGVAW